jgi:hypothetical protein
MPMSAEPAGYRLTAVGRTRLRQEADDWNRVVGIMAAALGMTPGSL